ncbi:AAA domain-containing protein [Actinokineospora auranticolor]|uniref:Caspase domain-containing protein n=1 Tax=Actinokineospora auranticolor TaxID=155976 RepID=A0A2S6H1C9_9PSEU|nr:AAA domain-containing protein [Actinokineospora auranticolor]PPK71298.1 caspase domain-containing protein [Actinokineospora auranticolor]
MTERWFPERGASRAVLIGASEYRSTELASIPAVAGNVTAMRKALSAPGAGLFAPEHCLVVGDGAHPATMAGFGTALSRAATEAADVLLVYYSGHGLLDDDGSLHLALSETEQANVGYTGIAISRIKQDLGQARARARVLILDCCFSGRAIAAMSAPDALVAGQLDVTGTYTLTSSSATEPSFAPPDAGLTAFTDALLRAFASPTPLTLDGIHEHVREHLRGLGLPEPHRRATDTANHLVLMGGAVDPTTVADLAPPPPRPKSSRVGPLAQALADANVVHPVTFPTRAARPDTATASRGPEEDRARVVEFWNMVELFSPQSAPKADPRKQVCTVEPGKPLPWEPGHPLARRELGPKQAWRHVVYLGAHPLKSVFDLLHQVFPSDEDSYDQRPAGDGTLAAFTVNAEGRPLLDSQVLSGCAWATSRVVSPGPDEPGWLTGFDVANDEFQGRFEALLGPDDESVQEARENGTLHELTEVLDERALAACFRLANDVVRLGTAVPRGEIRVHSQIVAARNANNTDGADFVNSMISAALTAVADEVRAANVGSGLRDYLRHDAELDVLGRVDVRDRLDAVLEAAAPNRVPLGRWPSDPEHPLALGQQLAVNNALAARGTDRTVLAVNGPPGTGKTTMLRDLIAGLLVERGRALAALVVPGDAFTDDAHVWKVEDYVRRVRGPRPELAGFEVVVASANNGAVENVTDEIPDRGAIDEWWRAPAAAVDYFAGVGSALLAGEPGGDEVDTAWALLAARLGNKANRSRFIDAFWFRTPPRGPATGDRKARHDRSGLMAILKDYEKSTPPSWTGAIVEFNRALAKARALGAERDELHRTLLAKPRAEEHARRCAQEADRAARARDAARARFAEADGHVRGWTGEHATRTRHRTENLRFKPGFWAWLTSFGKATRAWRERDDHLASGISTAERELHAARTTAGRLSHEASTADASAHAAHEEARRADDKLNALVAVLARGHELLGKHFPDPTWFTDRSRRELTALWTDAEWNRARTELFLAALRLHKVFIHHTARQLRQSLRGAMDILSGTAPSNLDEAAARAAWQSLFLVVPVVSTTFSSFARMFSHLGRESLGWLLVDEAGQATPQSVVGALWRARRAVIVGDPLQLEPITTVPLRVEQAIRREVGVDEQWLTRRTSVQRLADRLTPMGTSLPTDDGRIWVGTPLSVHRRCDEPMFGIANEIAYDGFMIHATGARGGAAYAQRFPTLPESKWLDVRAERSAGHWVPEEGAKLDQVLAALDKLGVDMGQVMVIAPFLAVADEVRTRARRFPGLVAGTVHVAQGKQADIVVLVLGSDPRRAGSRRWAASKPNLLNVAASRAKRRLYVIGNRELWTGQRHFDVLDRLLDAASTSDTATRPVTGGDDTVGSRGDR